MERKVKNKAYETKGFESFEIKSIDETGKFSGYASIFNIKDSCNDVVLPNAFKKSLALKTKPQNIKLLWQHSQTQPIGVINKIKEDNIGLYVEGKILMDVKKGKEAYSLMKSGAVSGLSIGYNVKKSFYNKKNQVRTISEVDLWEVSLVTFPANKHAGITFVKSHNPISETKELKKLNNLLDKALKILNN